MNDENDAENETGRALEAEATSNTKTRREAGLMALAVTIATGVTVDFAFAPTRAGKSSMLVALGLLYSVFTALTFARLWKRGETPKLFRPAGGDLTLGAATAGLLYGAARLVAMQLTPPGSPRAGWLFRIYLQLGDPEAMGRELVGGAVFVIAVLEEITWRGLVMRSLEQAFGRSWALVMTALLFALAHTPTLIQLGDPLAGPNPLIVMAALGCNLVWGLVYLRTSRLLPGIFAHAFFTWAVVEFPIWRP